MRAECVQALRFSQEIATLSVVLSMFEEKRSLVDGADFEQGEDGESVLVGSGPLAKLAFERRINPHVEYFRRLDRLDRPRGQAQAIGRERLGRRS